MVDVYLVKIFGIITRRLIIRLGFLLDFILFSVFFLFFIDVKMKYKKKTRKFNLKNYIPSTIDVFRYTSKLRFDTRPP